MAFVSCAAESDPEGPFGFESVWRAYRACRQGKRGTANAQRYDLRVLDRVVDTARALQDRSYAPSRSLCFVARQPKAREIHAATFADRVVHHLLVPRLEALYEPVFIHDSYSNRRGKGTHAAVARLGHFMRRLENAGNNGAWYLQLDIQNFFNTIDRGVLLRLLHHRLHKSVRQGRLAAAEADDLLWLCGALLERDPAEAVAYRGLPEEFARIPRHKRLANAPSGKGLPIGNLTSQFFANVYLNELDQFVKHRLKCRNYLRYVDDFILLHHDPARLAAWAAAIQDFLGAELRLRLKPERALRPASDGADFLGYIVRPHYRLVRRRVVGNLRARLDHFDRTLQHPAKQGNGLLLRREPREALRATLASYLAHFRHANAWRLAHSLWTDYPWLGLLFRLRPDWRLLPRWEPPGVASLRSQWRWFVRAYPETAVLVQVGNRFEAFGPDARWLQEQGMAEQIPPRRGFEVGADLPLRGLRTLTHRLRRRGIAHAFVAEEGYLRGGMRRRVLRTLWWPGSGLSTIKPGLEE